MKKNQLVVIISLCILSFSCWKKEAPEDLNVYKPESVVQFALGGRNYIFSGNEITTYHKPGDSLYAFVCATNKMKFKFQFIAKGFDKDSLLIFKGKEFLFWEDIFNYQASDNLHFIIHCTKRSGNQYGGYFTGYLYSNATLTATGLNGNFDLLYFKND